MPASYKSRVTQVQNFNQGISIFDDFLSNAAAGLAGLYYFTSVGGGGLADLGSSIDYPGFTRLRAFTAADTAALGLSQAVYTNNSALLATETRFKLSSVLNGSHTGQYYFGFVDQVGSQISAVQNAVVFLYDFSLSPNWIIRATIAGVTTQTVTTIPADINDTYFKIMIVPNYINFFKNNVFVGQLNVSTLPTTAFGPSWFVTKTAGSGTYTLTTDAIGLYQQFITPRIFSNTVVTQ